MNGNMNRNIHASLLAGRRAFTMLEMLIVIAIMATLFALVFGGLQAVQHAGRKARAKTEAKALVNAIKLYKGEFGQWPGQVQGSVDKIYINNCTNVIGPLQDNPRRALIEIREGAITEDGYKDPWGGFYSIAIDENNDGKVALSGSDFYGESTNIDDTVAVWCGGRDPANINEVCGSWQ